MGKKVNKENKAIARVIGEHKSSYVIRDKDADFIATIRGTLRTSDTFPKVGDFVEYTKISREQAVIESILPRKTQIIRSASERRRKSSFQKEQIIATNIDILFIVMGLDGDFNIRRLERYLTLAHQSKISPVIILNKMDTISDIQEYEAQISSLVNQAPIHFVSARTGQGMEAFLPYFHSDTTAVLLGSSGAGKSTIINWLLGTTIQRTGPVREKDSDGKHTTTSRELFSLPLGGYLIDTPGMRELDVIFDEEIEGDIFEEISSLAQTCRYTDCDHMKSLGCAVQEAILVGLIDEKQLESYKKLQKEDGYLKAKEATKLPLERSQKEKRMHKKILKQKHLGEDAYSDL